MKIAYLIIAHHKYPQLARLVNQLNRGGNVFVFHFSSNCQPDFFEQAHAAYDSQPNMRFAPRLPIYWGDFSMVQASLNCIRTLVESDFDYDYAILLSGQDYPLQPHPVICDTLAAGEGAQFFEYSDRDHMAADTRHRLYSHHLWRRGRHLWFPHQGEGGWQTRLFDGILSLLLPRVRTLPNGFSGYKGSFWWQLTRDCVEFIESYLRTAEGKKLLRYFHFTYHAAEYFYQTLLMNSPFSAHVVNSDNHFALWREDSGHPKDLGMEDLPAMLASGALYGRKFDIDKDPAVFDALDAHLDG
jgi:hypothetical protein